MKMRVGSIVKVMIVCLVLAGVTGAVLILPDILEDRRVAAEERAAVERADEQRERRYQEEERRWRQAQGLRDRETRAIRAAVEDTLIDPSSARFGDIKHDNDFTVACIEVNAKNRMGGYTGNTPFAVAKINGDWVSLSAADGNTLRQCYSAVYSSFKNIE